MMMISSMHLAIFALANASQLIVRKARKAPITPIREVEAPTLILSSIKEAKRIPPIPANTHT